MVMAINHRNTNKWQCPVTFRCEPVSCHFQVRTTPDCRADLAIYPPLTRIHSSLGIFPSYGILATFELSRSPMSAIAPVGPSAHESCVVRPPYLVEVIAHRLLILWPSSCGKKDVLTPRLHLEPPHGGLRPFYKSKLTSMQLLEGRMCCKFVLVTLIFWRKPNPRSPPCGL